MPVNNFDFEKADGIVGSVQKEAVGKKPISGKKVFDYISVMQRGFGAGADGDIYIDRTDDGGYVIGDVANRIAQGEDAICAGSYSTNPNNYPYYHNDSHLPQANGWSSLSTGLSSIASGTGSVAGGVNAASSAKQIVYVSEATGEGAIAMNGSLASAKSAIAIGMAVGTDNIDALTDETYGRNIATGQYAVAIGLGNKATATAAVAIGQNNKAGETMSFALGNKLITGKTRQTVIGQFNTTDTEAYFVVGGGTSHTARANAFTAGIDSNNEKYITIGSVKLTEAKLQALLNLLT